MMKRHLYTIAATMLACIALCACSKEEPKNPISSVEVTYTIEFDESTLYYFGIDLYYTTTNGQEERIVVKDPKVSITRKYNYVPVTSRLKVQFAKTNRVPQQTVSFESKLTQEVIVDNAGVKERSEFASTVLSAEVTPDRFPTWLESFLSRKNEYVITVDDKGFVKN